jgi:hypothetical protein
VTSELFDLATDSKLRNLRTSSALFVELPAPSSGDFDARLLGR